MRKLSFFSLLVALLLTACQNGLGEQTTPAGNKYVLHEKGGGPLLNTGDYAYFNLDARVRDSVVFSTREAGEPQIVPVVPDSVQNPQLEPILDIIRYLSVGDSVTYTVEIDSIPPMQRAPFMAGEEYLYYDIDVVESVDEATFEARQAAKQAEAEAKFAAAAARQPEVLELLATTQEAYTNGTLENIQSTETGLRYVIHEEGTGPKADPSKIMAVQYVGALSSDGTVFDQSFDDGMPLMMGRGRRVIAGWEEGISLFKEGTKATLIIPSELGYGATGNGPIPPDAELMFYVELEEVR
ncbi:MAG: FKBP-type peptidyl-prolyl cis-trans isomerase [Bacteroidota bacterium]